RTIERTLEVGDQRVDSGTVGLSRPWRGHDAPAQLAHRLLEHVGMLDDTLGCDSLEADARHLGAVVVTRHAVLLHRRQLDRSLSAGCLHGISLGRCGRLRRRNQYKTKV